MQAAFDFFGYFTSSLFLLFILFSILLIQRNADKKKIQLINGGLSRNLEAHSNYKKKGSVKLIYIKIKTTIHGIISKPCSDERFINWQQDYLNLFRLFQEITLTYSQAKYYQMMTLHHIFLHLFETYHLGPIHSEMYQ